MSHLQPSAYLLFTLQDNPGRKTLIVAVTNKRSGDLLGMIKWWGAWRQYTLQPAPGTIWNPSCLEDVCRVAKGLTWAQRRSQSLTDEDLASLGIAR